MGPSPFGPWLLAVVLLAEALAAGAVLVSRVRPDRGLWPPTRPAGRSGRGMTLLFNLAGSGVIALGLVDRGSLPTPAWLRWGVALPLWLAGNGLALAGLVTLGAGPSMGAEGALVRHGPYRRVRHPQYAGFTAALVGWPWLIGSAWALAPSLAAIVPLWLAAMAEERRLARRHGDAYASYRRSIPRWRMRPRRPGADAETGE